MPVVAQGRNGASGSTSKAEIQPAPGKEVAAQPVRGLTKSGPNKHPSAHAETMSPKRRRLKLNTTLALAVRWRRVLDTVKNMTEKELLHIEALL